MLDEGAYEARMWREHRDQFGYLLSVVRPQNAVGKGSAPQVAQGAVGMSLQACADLVARGDPDRFAATMAAPVAARRVLFPLYAFNLEVARAPWVTQEPLIAEMRLQWWADALDEIAGGGPVRRHEVTEPLADILAPEDAAILQRVVNARRRDARREPLADWQALERYLAETSGALLWAVMRGLSSGSEARAMAVGTAQGLANYLLAVPAFLARGQNPLPEMTEVEFAEMLSRALAGLDQPRGSRAERIAELAAWRARSVLLRARRDPAAVPEGRLEEAPVKRQLALLWAQRRLSI